MGMLGTNLILLAFGVKCAFPLLHNWLQDSYGHATVTEPSSYQRSQQIAVYRWRAAFWNGYVDLIGAAMAIFQFLRHYRERSS